MKLIWYGGRLFRPVETSRFSQTSAQTIFKYEQIGDRVTATYSGGDIDFGHIIGRVNSAGNLHMRYHHIDSSGQIASGRCHTRAEVLAGGKLRLHEQWQWDAVAGETGRTGTSILEEI